MGVPGIRGSGSIMILAHVLAREADDERGQQGSAEGGFDASQDLGPSLLRLVVAIAECGKGDEAEVAVLAPGKRGLGGLGSGHDPIDAAEDQGTGHDDGQPQKERMRRL